MIKHSFAVLFGLLLLLVWPTWALASLHAHPDQNGIPVVRSLESLRDRNERSWQLIAWRQGPAGGDLTLRVVGYPGRLRLDHPSPLKVQGGLQSWVLDDITLDNPSLAADGRAAAFEFDLEPLIRDLDRNRPLEISLPGAFMALPVPPYVVAEWRSLPEA